MSLRGRIILLIILVVMGIMFISPSIQWYFTIPEETKNIALGSLPQIKSYAKGAATREYNKIREFVAAEKPPRLAAEYARFLRAVFETSGQVDPKAFADAVEASHRDDILNIKNLKDLTLQLGLDLQGGLYISLAADFAALERQQAPAPDGKEPAEQKTAVIDREKKLQDAMEYLLSMLDQFGTQEPTIRRQIGSDAIIVELPGAADPERIKKVILGKGRLNFHMVDEEANQKWAAFWTSQAKYRPDSPAFDPSVINPADGTVTPPPELGIGSGTVIYGSFQKDKYGMDELVSYVAVEKVPIMPGEAVKDAKPEADVQDRSAYVTFALGDFTDKNGTRQNGADYFGNLTEKNVGRNIAVVLDNKVFSAATIKQKIPNGQVQVTGRFTYKDADDLAKVLRSGALPVPLTITSAEQVGASAGKDTIASGITGALIGAVLVLAFMLIYYKGAGLFAVIALVFNVFFLLAVLSVTSFTLSLTSIAGIILTIGMSVDANVLIYERMKEEFRLGKTTKAAVKAGFDRAFWTILDSNLTTFIAGIVLALFTKGSIQSFAFTLCVGIITSFFTAMFVSRILFDISTDVFKLSKLSISWRRLQ